MPARVVLVHDDPEFTAMAVAALRQVVGCDLAWFSDSHSALDALEAAEKIELLITPAQFPPGQPHGVALAG